MAGTVRLKTGDGQDVRHPAAASTQIDVGMLLYQNAAGNAAPVSEIFASSGSGLEVGEILHHNYLGVAADYRTGND